MTKLGPALDYDPFAQSSGGTILGEPLDFDPFAKPEPVEEETIPGSLEAKRQLLNTQSAATARSVANIEDIQARMAKGERFDPMTELEASPENLARLKKEQSDAMAAAEKTRQQVEGQPKTEFSKSVAKARETNNLPDLAKTLWEGVKKDPIGAGKDLTSVVVGGAPIAAATIVGGPVGGGIYGGAMGYSEALIDETINRSPNPDQLRADIARGDTKEFDKIYSKYRDDIDAAATRKGVVGGTFGAVFGMIPGANTFTGSVKNLMLKYAPLGTVQALAETEITKVPEIDVNTGKPKLDAHGNVILRDADRMSPSEIAIAYGIGVAAGIPFEAMHGVKKGVSKAIPEGRVGEEPQPPPGAGPEMPPGAGPEAPSGGPEAPAGGPENIDISQTRGYQEATQNDAILRHAFEEDIKAGRMTREEALDRIAGMSKEEVAAQAKLFRQVGGEHLAEKPLDLADFEYIQSKRQPSEPRAEEAPQPEAGPQTRVPVEEAEILKGYGYTVDDILTMNPAERASRLAEAKQSNAAASKLTDEELTMLKPEPAAAKEAPKAEGAAPEDRPTRLGAPIELPPPRAAEPTPEAPAVPPSQATAVEARGPEGLSPTPSEPPAAPSAPEVARGMIEQGVPPIVAMKRAAEQRQTEPQQAIPMPPPAPIEAAPIAMPPPAEAAVAEPKPAVTPVVEPEPIVEAPKAETAQFETVKGHAYGSMVPKRFMTMIDSTPNFANSIQGKTPAEVGTGKIKVRVDPKLIPQGGKIETAVAAMPAAVKEVIVSKDAYKGLSQKDVAKLNKALAKIEASGGKVTLEGEAPVFEKKKRARPTNELGSFIASIGGIKGTDIQGRPDPELKNIRDRKLPGLVRKDTGMDLWAALNNAVAQGFYPEYRGEINETRDYGDVRQKEMLDRFVADLEKGGIYPEGKSAKEDRKASLRQEEEERYAEIENTLRADLVSFGIKEHPDVFATAVQILERGEAKDPLEAYELAVLEESMKDPSVLEPVIHDITGEDYWRGVEEQRIPSEGEAIPAEYEPMEATLAYETEPRKASETGAIRREGGKREEGPAAKAEAEGPSERIPEPVSGKAEKPVEEAPIDEQGILDRVQKMLDAKLRPGYRVAPSVRPADKGKGVLIYSPDLKKPSFHLIEDIPAWIKGVIRIDPTQALKAWEVPFTPVSFDDLAQKVLNEKLGPEYKIKNIKHELHIVTPDKKNIKLEEIGFKGGNIEKFADAVDKYKASLEGITKAPVEEKGVEGKPQLVVPGAEKISGKELAQRKAEAPLKAKVPQKDVGGLFSDDANQKDLMDLIRDQKKQVEEKRETPKWLIDTANDYQSVPVYSNKDYGLMLGYSKNGVPIYAVVKKEGDMIYNATVDLSQYKNPRGRFTKEELAELKAARDEIIAADNAAAERDPEGPFKNGDFVKSEHMPESLLNLLEDWTKMLGLNVRIYLTTPEDAILDKFSGRFRRVIRAKWTGAGKKIPFGGKDYAISLTVHSKMSRNIEALAHELGHILKDENWKALDDKTKLAIIKDHEEWVLRSDKLNVREHIKAMRPHVMAKFVTGVMDIPASKLEPYWLSFDEYFADMVARYMVSEAKPQSAIGRYFKRIADALKRLYESVAGLTGKTSKSMKDYLDGLMRTDDTFAPRPEPKPEKDFGMEEEAKTSFGQETADDIDAMNQKHGMKPRPKKTKDVPVETTMTMIQRNFQDEFGYLKDAQRYIEDKRGGPLPEAQDAYARQALMPGRVSERISDLEKDEIQPIKDKMVEKKVSAIDLGMYLYAKHAKERNAEMAKRDPKRFGADGGSGWANGTADEVLQRYDNRKAEMEELANMVYKMLDNDLDRRYAAGLLSQDEYNEYKTTYKHYVPLQGFAEEHAEEERRTQYNLGRGVSVTRKESETALGRLTSADNPLVYAILKAEEGVYRIEKNRAAEALLNLARNNPNPDLWTVNKMKLHKELGADGRVKWVTDGMVDENTVIAKIGGVPYYITLKHPGLAEAYKKIGAVYMNPVIRGIGKLTRVFSQLQTSKNPAFLIQNTIRDFQGAVAAAAVDDKKLAAAIVKNYPRAFRIAMQAVRGKLTPENKAIYDQWRLTGGRISYNMFKDVMDRADELNRLVGDLDPVHWSNLPKKVRVKAMNLLKSIWDSLDKIGQPFEEVSRLSTFISGIEMKNPNGTQKYTPEQSARKAQDYVTNFFRRGKYTPITNALWAFSNAATQGDVFLGQKLLFDKSGRRITYGLLSLFSMLAAWNLMVSGQDEMEDGRNNYMNIPEAERSSGIIVKTGPGAKDYFRIPTLPFFASLWDLTNNATMVAFGQRSPVDAGYYWLANLFTSHNPAASSSWVSTLFPTITKPFVDITMNENYFGVPIHPKEAPWNEGIENYKQTTAGTSPLANDFAEFVYNGSNGVVDVYPGDAEYIAKFVTGQLGATTMGIADLFNSITSGKEIEAARVPVLKYFVPTRWDESGRYYQLQEQMIGIVNRRRDRGEKTPGLAVVRKTDSLLKDLRKQLRENASDTTKSSREKQKVENDIRSQMKEAYITGGRFMADFIKDHPKE